MTISKFLPDQGELKPDILVWSRRKSYPYNNLLGSIKEQYSTLVDGSKDWIVISKHKNRTKTHTINDRYLTRMDCFAISWDIEIGDEVFNPYSLDSHVIDMMNIGHSIRKRYYKKLVRLSGNPWLENGKEIVIQSPINGISKVKCPTCLNFH